MNPASAKPPTRKRNRKRKRRAASTSSSSSSSSSSSDADVLTPSRRLDAEKARKESPESPSSSSGSESDSDSSSDSSDHPSKPLTAQQVVVPDQTQHASRRRSPSPPPPATTIPSFVPSVSSVENDAQKEQILKDRFRKFWMTSVADGFKDDLEEIRKEPNLGTSRLSLLIDSLASGADVFSSSSRPGDPQAINEMEVVLQSH